MATVTAQALTNAGLAPTLSSAAGGGDLVECGDTVHLLVISGSTACTLTITTPGAPYGDAVADAAFVIPVNSGLYSSGAPFEIALTPGRFADSTGYATLAWSATTNVKFAVVRR